MDCSEDIGNRSNFFRAVGEEGGEKSQSVYKSPHRDLVASSFYLETVCLTTVLVIVWNVRNIPNSRLKFIVLIKWKHLL